jgi:hypothetical protein
MLLSLNQPPVADNFTHAFSPRALSAQESLINSYGNLLITRLSSQLWSPTTPFSQERAKIDIAAWLNFTTFDLIGDLTSASPSTL